MDFLHIQSVQTECGAHQGFFKWVPRDIFLGAKQPKCEANHSNPLSAEDKNEGSYTWNSAYAFMVRTGTTLQNILVHYTYGLLGWGIVQFVVC